MKDILSHPNKLSREKKVERHLSNYLTTKEVSKILGVHPQTVSDWAREGIIPSYKPGSLRRFKESEIEDWMQQRRQNVFDSNLSPKLVFSWREFEKLFKGGTSVVKKVGKTGCRWFTGFGGFYWKKDSHGIKRWMIWFWDEVHKRVIKAVPLVTNEKEALTALEGERRIAFMRRYNPEEAEKGNKPKYKLSKLVDEWLAQSTRKNKICDKSVGKSIKNDLGEIDIAKLSRADIKQWFAKCLKNDDAPSTVNLKGQVLRVILNYAVEMGYDIEENPVVAKDFPKVPKKEKVPLEMDELKQLFQAAEQIHRHMVPVMICACMTGMRRSEIQNLKREDVDLENRWLIVRDPKEKKDKEIPINNVLYPVLKELEENANGDSEYVFSYLNGRFCRTTQIPIKLHFEEIVEEAGLKGRAHFHLLRHTAASLMAKAGADIVSIQYMLGHAYINTTQIYLHPHRDAKRKAAELLEKQLPIGKLIGGHLTLQG